MTDKQQIKAALWVIAVLLGVIIYLLVPSEAQRARELAETPIGWRHRYVLKEENVHLYTNGFMPLFSEEGGALYDMENPLADSTPVYR